ncbi:MAG: group III truncated hemoglobin [Proteobacteria bacterium]|nr:group III truncated hemoglobin [Pseudomonadota bacterium]
MTGALAENSSPPVPSEAEIKALVHAFYAKVRNDRSLGPIFDRVITDWDPHLAKMCDFWSSVMRTSGRYKGNPMAAHLRLKTVQPEHFQRWLELFAQTAREQFESDLAEGFADRSENIARSLQLGMFFRPGEAAVRPRVTE